MSLFKNISWQTLAVYLGSLASIVLVPYLARTLGAYSFGELAVAQSVAMILSLFMDFGFLYSGTNEVLKVKKTSSSGLGQTIYSALYAKLGIQIFAALLFGLLWWHFGKDLLGPRLALGVVLWSFSQSLLPVWVAWGLENHRLYAILEAAPKILALPFIIILVNNHFDNYKVLYIQSLFFFLLSIYYWGIILRKYKITHSVKFIMIKNILLKSSYMFLYRFFGNVYLNIGPYLLGQSTGAISAAIYAAVDKFMKALLLANEPLLRVFIPVAAQHSSTISQQDMRSKESINTRWILGPVLILILYTITIVGITLAYSDTIISVVLGNKFLEQAPGVTEVFIVSLLIIPLHAISKLMLLGYIVPIHDDCGARANLVQALGLVVLLLLSFFFWEELSALKMAWIVVFSQGVVMIISITLLLYCRRLSARCK